MATRNLDVVRRWVGHSKDWLGQFLLSAPADHRIAVVVVMGSAVRERGHRRSDFDLLILYREKRLSLDAPIEVDIRQYPVEKAEGLIESGHEIVCWAMKFGTSLYDPEQIWERLKDRWRDRVPMPSADEAHKRGHKSLERAREMLAAGDEVAASDLLLAALTQFVRARLIQRNVFPASRPELPSQLLSVSPSDPLAALLENAMFKESDSATLLKCVEASIGATPTT